jgi:hypothetical protein
VSPLLRDEWRVVLAPSQVSMARTGMTVCTVDCPGAAPGEPAWAGALVTLEQQLKDLGGRRANLHVTLSNQFVRYALVPWQARLHGAAEEAAYVGHYFAQMFGSAAARWDICVSAAPEGRPRLASAIDVSLLDALRGLCASTGIRLKAVWPQLASTFNRYRSVLAASCGWLVMVETGCLCIGLFEDGKWLSICTTRTEGAWQLALPALLEREVCLANPAGAADQVFLWAPADAANAPPPDGRFQFRQLLAPLP